MRDVMVWFRLPHSKILREFHWLRLRYLLTEMLLLMPATVKQEEAEDACKVFVIIRRLISICRQFAVAPPYHTTQSNSIDSLLASIVLASATAAAQRVCQF